MYANCFVLLDLQQSCSLVWALPWSLGDTGDDDSPSDTVVVVWVKLVWLLPVYDGEAPDDIVVESVVLYEHES